VREVVCNENPRKGAAYRIARLSLGHTGQASARVSSQVFNVGVQQFNAGEQIAVADADADADATATAGAFGSASAVAIADANAVNVANAAGIDIHTVNVSLNNWWW
jgi:hypothetical protein